VSERVLRDMVAALSVVVALLERRDVGHIVSAGRHLVAGTLPINESPTGRTGTKSARYLAIRRLTFSR
jgi:hypothetical protein